MRGIGKEKRTRVKAIRLTESEQNIAKHNAERCGLSFSSYARARLLKHRIQTEDSSLLIGQLNKLGGLLKHLHNEGLGHSQKTAEILSLIRQAVTQVINGKYSQKEAGDVG